MHQNNRTQFSLLALEIFEDSRSSTEKEYNQLESYSIVSIENQDIGWSTGMLSFCYFTPKRCGTLIMSDTGCHFCIPAPTKLQTRSVCSQQSHSHKFSIRDCRNISHHILSKTSHHFHPAAPSGSLAFLLINCYSRFPIETPLQYHLHRYIFSSIKVKNIQLIFSQSFIMCSA